MKLQRKNSFPNGKEFFLFKTRTPLRKAFGHEYKNTPSPDRGQHTHPQSTRIFFLSLYVFPLSGFGTESFPKVEKDKKITIFQ